MTPLETVQHIYASFGKGDVPAILACLAEDVDWEHDGFPNAVPWLQPRRGRDGVTAFFGSLAEHLDFKAFQPTRLLVHGDLVIGLCDLQAVVRGTGKTIVEVDEVHLWRFNAQGQVQRFRHRADTLQHGMALRNDG